jgi:Mn-dependent DtxR family transcriptional regulator
MQEAAVEDYLRTIYALIWDQEPASTSPPATRLGASAPAVAVNAVLERLAERGQ